ncbi:hypothetical protein RHSIM_Rhsim01G0145600 [Rhododendron simsii]|uniref:DUF4283 domain-containing protein n=1 Tax=Rhododendron simsii TaxID=118357 RepID=A0A834LWA8_RHOSS|nr:hypothetical protein RHSIM_Rhsim01G0145600 [Rhododendron simsii]
MATASSGNDFNSCFPPLGMSNSSDSKLGFPPSGIPNLLKRPHAAPIPAIPSVVSGSIPMIPIKQSLGKVNLFDILDSVTISSNDHLEIHEGDTPTVQQITGLTKEVSVLCNDLIAKTKLIESLNVKDQIPVTGQGVRASWKDKVSPPSVSHSRMKLQFFPPAVEGETIRVPPPQHVEILGAEQWKNCIVGHFVDKKLPFLSVRSIAFNNWGKFGLKEVLANENGFFFFQFGFEGAYRQISEVGAWHFGNRLMVLQEWHPDLVFEKEGLSKLPLWIQLFNVPLQYWSEEGLSYIASAVGKPLYADEMTESAKRISYAKICVEVDIHSPLPHSIDLLTSTGRVVQIRVKYPWRPLRCVSCHVFGHSECSQQIKVPAQSVFLGNTQSLPQNKVWVVKSGKAVEDLNTNPEPSTIQKSPMEADVNLPCTNQFSALQGDVLLSDAQAVIEQRAITTLNGGITGCAAAPLRHSEPLVDVDLKLLVDDTCKLDEAGISTLVPHVLEVPAVYDFLPHDLNPDVVFEALNVMEASNSKKANGG